MNLVQAGRRLTINTPLGPDALLVDSLVGVEALSQPFQFDVQLLSPDEAVRFDSIVGKGITLTLIQADGSERYWNGVVSRFSQGPRERLVTRYYATVVPWLWLLTRTADCRIFQKKKVPDILEQIFTDLGFKKSDDFEMRLYGSFVERDYCVQYRETDFNFVSRLMEEEGIYYFFSHEQNKHTLILTNDPAGHKPCPAQSKFRFIPNPGQNRPEDSITEWTKIQEFRPESYSVTDYNFETPSSSLAVSVPGRKKFDIYDYPGEYLKRDEGDSVARVRMQEQSSRGVVIQGSSDCRAFTSGFSFELTDHYRQEFNGQYVLTGVRHSANQGGYGATSNGAGADISYTNSFECIPASVTYRPQRVTPQPFVQGCQTAVVVGPGGEEIYTDQYGRVKVQFHWDREGKRNENSSCWVRVSYPWAGKGWGAIHIPRIGQEVVVDFLEGNPDCPIIIGRVYNAEAMPPFGLPGQAVVSGIKSDSTKGGGGNNEISMDDTKGNELINVHAQYDQQKKVEHDERVNVGNDRTEEVGNDEKITIGHDRTEEVKNNENITIGNDRTEEVKNNESIKIGVDRTEKVGSNEKISIGSNRTEDVGSNETISIGADRTESVGSNEMVTVTLTRTHNVGVNDMLNVGAAQEVTVGGLQMLTVGVTRSKNVGTSESVDIGTSQSIKTGTSRSLDVGSDQNVKVGKKRNTSIGTDDTMKVGKTWAVEAGDQIAFKTGSSSIVMKKNGSIAIQCKDLTVKASGKINVKASGKITMKGQQILEN